MFQIRLSFLPFVFLALLLLFSEAIVNDVYAKFTDVTTEVGLGQIGPSYGSPLWGDFNNDGNLDIIVPRHLSNPALYKNTGAGQFIDELSVSGIVPLFDVDRHGWAWGDYDNDGNLDLFISRGGCQGGCVGNKTDELWKGNGRGEFINTTDFAGVNNAFGRGRSAFWVDYNNDGFLDLFVLNYQTDSILYKNNGNGTFRDVTKISKLEYKSGSRCSWIDYDNDGFMDIFITPDRLFKNNGNGSFTSATVQSGITPILRYGMGIAWGDYNNDGFLDLYIARGNNINENSLVWNSSRVVFLDLEVTNEDGIDFVTTGANITFNLYVNNSYQPDKVFIGGAKSNPPSIPFTISVADGIPQYVPGTDMGFFIWKDPSGIWHLRYSSDGTRKFFYGVLSSDGSFTTVIPTFTPVEFNFKDTFYRNNGNGTFTDITDFSGVGNRTGSHIAAVWGDYNNDGWIDLYVTDSGDISGNRPNILYKNNSDGTFTDVAANEGVDAMNVLGSHFGAAWGDYNNDGFLDLIVKNGKGNSYPLAIGSDILYKNQGNSNHWLKVKLEGATSNRLGIGAKLTLTIDGKMQYRENNGGGGGELHSQGSGPIHFGLGNANMVDSLTIKWPSGITQTLTNIAPNQSITVIEPPSL